jgi:hypothetical protein
VTPFGLVGAVLFAFLIGSAAFYVMLVIGALVLSSFAKDPRSEAELQSILNKDFRKSESRSSYTGG